MSGLVFLSDRKWFRHVRIYIDAISAVSMKYQVPETIGEAVYMSHHGHRALELKYSWGMGVEAWIGPVVGKYPLSSNSISYAQSNTPPFPTDEAPARNPSPGCAIRASCPHRLNPKAVEFFPASAIGEEHRTQTESYPSPSQSSSISFLNQYYTGNMLSDDVHGSNVDPMAAIPFAHDTTGWVWDPYIQGWVYRPYNTQPWGVQDPFHNLQPYSYWGPACFWASRWAIVTRDAVSQNRMATWSRYTIGEGILM